MVTVGPESGDVSQAAAAYLRIAPNRAAADVVERLARGASAVDEAARAYDRIEAEGRTIEQVNVLLASLYWLLTEREPGGRDPATRKPVLVGVLDDPSIISSARTYQDGSSLILVPTGAIDLCEAMSRCVALLLSAIFDRDRPGGRRGDLTEVALAATKELVTEIRDRFDDDRPQGREGPVLDDDRPEQQEVPVLDDDVRAALDLVRGLFRLYLVVRRTWNTDPGMPMKLDTGDEYVGRQLGRLALAFIVAHELAHLRLGHIPLPGNEEARTSEQARRQELDADATAGRLVTEFAVIAYDMRPREADSFARLAGIIALGMNWFYEAGLMIRGSDLHPSPEARMYSALLGALDMAEVEPLALLISNVTMRAGLTFTPLPEDAWNTVLEHPNSALQDVMDAGFDILSNAPSPDEAAEVSLGLDILLDAPTFDMSVGIPLERFRTLVGQSSEFDGPAGESIDTALRQIGAGDARAALETLGVRPRRIEAIVDTARTLSFFGLTQAILTGETFTRSSFGPFTSRAAAAQLSHYLTRLLKGESRDDLAGFDDSLDDDTAHRPKG